MTLWKRLSVRHEPQSPDEPYEGVPEHLLSPLVHWIQGFFPFDATGQIQEPDLLRLVALATRIPLVPGDPDESAYRTVMDYCISSPAFCLDFVDALLRFAQPDELALENLRSVLLVGGSAWDVAADGKSLMRRLDATTVSRQSAATVLSDKASPLLKEAFQKAYGRRPKAVEAWSQAVNATEAVLVPIVYPNHYDVSLGDVISELDAHPDRWQLSVNSSHDPVDTIKTFVTMLRMIWEVPGLTDDGKGKPSVHETQAIVQLSVTIVQWVRSGLFHHA